MAKGGKFTKLTRALVRVGELEARRVQLTNMLNAVKEGDAPAYLTIGGFDAQPLTVPRQQARNLLQSEIDSLDTELKHIEGLLGPTETAL